MIIQIVLDRQDFIGEASSVLSELVHKKSSTTLPLKLNGKDRGSIIVKCEEMNNVCGVIQGQLTCPSLSSRSFYRIFNILFLFFLFPFTPHIDEKNGEIPVYKSEVTKKGMWKPFEMDVTLFCNGDMVSFQFRFDPLEPPDHHQALSLQVERQPYSYRRSHRTFPPPIPPRHLHPNSSRHHLPRYLSPRSPSPSPTSSTSPDPPSCTLSKTDSISTSWSPSTSPAATATLHSPIPSTTSIQPSTLRAA